MQNNKERICKIFVGIYEIWSNSFCCYQIKAENVINARTAFEVYLVA
jgi:hypothetical protein